MKKNQMFLFHDTETTGTSAEDRIIETAHCLVKNGKMLDYKEELCNPKSVTIKPAAAMTHGYRNSDIKDKPEFSKIASANTLISLSEDKNCFYVAHNAPFDIGMLEKEGITWPKSNIIDTLKVSKHLYGDRDDIEMHKLQYFRYFFDEFEELEPIYMKKFGIEKILPHTALSDILVLWIFTEKMLKDFNLSAEDMVRLTQTPVLERKLSFGKVFPKGKLLSEIVSETYIQYGKTKLGYEYLIWMLDDIKDMNPDLEYSIKYWLGQGILTKKINSISSMEKYINWNILFTYNEEEQELALALLQKNKDFLPKLKNSYIKQAEEKISVLKNTENLEEKEQKILEKEIFFLNYLINYR